MSERIELWATVRKGCVHAYYRDPDFAARVRRPDEQIVHLVELREGEPHPDKVDVTIEDMRDQRDAAIERAEKAEAEIANVEALANKLGMEAMDTERKRLKDIIEGLRGQIEWLIKEHAQECDDFHDAKADERARFERETAARLLANPQYDWNNDNRVFSLDIPSAVKMARQLADACFGAKEAGNG